MYYIIPNKDIHLISIFLTTLVTHWLCSSRGLGKGAYHTFDGSKPMHIQCVSLLLETFSSSLQVCKRKPNLYKVFAGLHPHSPTALASPLCSLPLTLTVLQLKLKCLFLQEACLISSLSAPVLPTAQQLTCSSLSQDDHWIQREKLTNHSIGS